MKGGVGLFVPIFFCQNTGAKKGFPLQSLTQAAGSPLIKKGFFKIE
jgi:hypothetical protein